MKVVGTCEEGVFLVALDETQGVVYDRETGRIGRPMNIQSIIARGYWKRQERADAEQALRDFLATPSGAAYR